VNTVDWLLEGSPAIRCQAMRDLTDASPAVLATERARVSREGIGAEILVRQEPDGSWRRAGNPVWLSTLFTLLLLRSTGIDPRDPGVETALARPEASLRWNDGDTWDLRPAALGGNPFFQGEVEPCINGGVLAFGSYFGHPNELLAQQFIREQLADGGWNCEAPTSARASFHTTICVLEGLLEYERGVGSAPDITAVRRRGEEYLLQRRLFRRLSTGEIADPAFLNFAFPPRYHYDVLRALDYFQSTGASPDPRMEEAVSLVENKRQPDGRWLLDAAYDEALVVGLDETPGEPSRWNTLRALRVLRWYRQ